MAEAQSPQVLSNLIGNAIKFTPAGGQIRVSCARSSPESKEVQVSVSDTGAGIAPEKIGTIFDRFSQINSHDRRGIGLGLYIAKMMVEEHPGRIWVDSKLGEGSNRFRKPLTLKTRNNVLAVVSNALRYAEEVGLIDEAPRIRPYKFERPEID